MQDFRVIDLPERTTLDSSDYTMIDSAENGTNKYLLSRQTAETDAKIATAVGGVEEELNAAVEGIEESITALQGDVETVETTLGTKADKDGTYPDMAVGSVLGTNTVTDREPYFLRPSASIGDREFDTLVGGTFGWNQLCNGSSVTVESGHKYYMIKGGTASVGASDGTAITGLTSGTDIVIDLTTLFGSTIADYIYGLEQATAGAGVAWVRKYLPQTYYAYCAPTLKHVSGVSAHVMRDANNNIIGNYPIDSTWVGMGVPKLDSANKLYFDGDTYASDGTVTERYGIVDLGSLNWTYITSSTAPQFRAALSNTITSTSATTTYNAICAKYPILAHYTMNDGNHDKSASIFYASVPGINITDSSYSDAATFKTAMSGVMLVYELATPTTEQSTPFTNPQICDPDGTEEYVTSNGVPVGHETEYVENLADKLTDIPDLPTTAGTYSLKVTVSGGVPSYSWVSA